MKKKQANIIGLVIGLTICVVILLWPDKQHDTNGSQHTEVVADHDTLKVHATEYRRIIDSLSINNYRLDSANKSLVKSQSATRRQLDAKSSEVKTLVAQIREINQDTGYFGHLLDSLNEQVESLTYLVMQYGTYADSINNVNDSVKINNEATVKEKDKRIAELQTKYDKLYKSYTELFDTSQGLMKDLKRQKFKTKVAAVLGAAGALIILLK